MGFFSNAFVKNITIGNNVKFLNNSMYNAFNGCSNFNQPVNIPNGVTNLTYTFRNCSNFNQPINIPNGITNVAYTFQSCYNFNQPINIPNSVTHLFHTFSECRNFNQPINIPNSATNLYFTFNGCYNFNQPINIPENVTNVWGALCRCNNVSSVNIYAKNISFAGAFILYRPNNRSIYINVPNNSLTKTTFLNANKSGTSIHNGLFNWTKYTNYAYNHTNKIYLYWNYF